MSKRLDFVRFPALVVLLALAALVGTVDAQQKHFLWRVSSGSHSIYLAGSIHFLKKEHYPLKGPIEEALDNSQKLVLEIELQSATQEQALTLAKGLYRDGTTLQQNVAPETFMLAERIAKDLGLDLRLLNPLKPWVVALTLTALKLQKLGFDPNYGVDQYLASRAKDSGKATSGLESLEFQIDLLDQIPRAGQESMLLQTLKDLDRLGTYVEEIVQSWARGDTRAVEELMHAGAKTYPDVHQKLIVERNRRWVAQIEKIIDQGGNTMVVVGAAHLVGKDGVVELLKQRGYRVEQL